MTCTEQIFGAKNAARYAKQKYGVTLKAAESIIRSECLPHRRMKHSVWSAHTMGCVSLPNWYLYSSSEVDRVFSSKK